MLGAALEGPADLVIRRPCPAGDDDAEGITFAENERFLSLAEDSAVAAVIVQGDLRTGKPALRAASARLAFGALLRLAARPLPLDPGIHETAIVHAEATVDPGARIGPWSVIERGATIGAEARVFPFCYVGENCEVGRGAVLYPHVVLYRDVRIGPGSVVHAGAVLGADGFGFAWDGARRRRIDQVGSVWLGEEVEIGANSCVDRATCGSTMIGTGTKVDNLVQIGHNCRIGKHGAIAAQTGLAGSATVGDRVVMGGQVAINDHTAVGNDLTLAGRTGVAQDLPDGGAYFGMPAKPAREEMRLLALQKRMPDLFDRVKRLEAEVAALRARESAE
jgi:UDP-3-O-[3-hydroxymyristoyl] glucosamine N-acyltransferase